MPKLIICWEAPPCTSGTRQPSTLKQGDRVGADNASAYFSQALAFSNLTQYSAAAKDLAKATELAPKEAIIGSPRKPHPIAETRANADCRSKTPRDWCRLSEYRQMKITKGGGKPFGEDPSSWHLRLGRYHQKTGNLKAATAHYALLLELKPRNTHVLEKMLQVQNRAHYGQAQKFRARYLKQRRKELRSFYAPSRNPYQRKRPRPDSLSPISSRSPRHHHLRMGEQEDTDALYTFVATTSNAGGLHSRWRRTR